MSAGERWVARITPVPPSGIDDLLGLSLGLDVWERDGDALVVAAAEGRLADIERQGLAHVERMMTTSAYQTAHSEDLPRTD